ILAPGAERDLDDDRPAYLGGEGLDLSQGGGLPRAAMPVDQHRSGSLPSRCVDDRLPHRLHQRGASRELLGLSRALGVVRIHYGPEQASLFNIIIRFRQRLWRSPAAATRMLRGRAPSCSWLAIAGLGLGNRLGQVLREKCERAR